MAKQAELVIRAFTDDEGVARIGLTRELVAPDGARTRTKGGIWVAISDAEMLSHARDRALDFAQACDSALAKLAEARKPKPAPARKIPTPPTPAQKAASKPPIASLPKPAPATGRITSKPAPAPRVVAPTPVRDEADDLLDWLTAVQA